MGPDRTFRHLPWWDWEIEPTTHLLKRMVDRKFSEVDLRVMLDSAIEVRRASDPARWIVETQHDAHPWRIIVEPDEIDRSLVIVTAYAVDDR